MLDADRIRTLRRITAPVLTAYVDTNPGTPRNQGEPPGCPASQSSIRLSAAPLCMAMWSVLSLWISYCGSSLLA